MHAQPHRKIVHSDIFLHWRFPGSILTVIPGGWLLSARIGEANKPLSFVKRALEKDVCRIVVALDFEFFPQIIVLLVSIFLDWNLANDEILDRMCQLAEIFERILLFTVSIGLVHLR